MIYANPVEEVLATGTFYDHLAAPFYLSPDKLAGDYSPVRFARELKLFRRFCPRGEILDVGCSTGAFLYQIKKQFAGSYETTGIDVAGPALDYAEQKGVRVLRESFLTKDFANRAFSAVTFWAVMEHLMNPREFLSKTATILQPSGYCFVLVPNFQSLAMRLLGKKYRYILPQHVNYFTRSTLQRLVKMEPRFEIIYCSSTHFNPLVIWQDWRRSGKSVADGDRAKLLKRTSGYKQNPVLKPIKIALTATEAVLAKLNMADNLVVVLRNKSA
jgi:2-polyprenyl-3-methyl-5-hydroxy-6-metoxy-1,4-benzoquinol methylase